jgi:hypothetical protein
MSSTSNRDFQIATDVKHENRYLMRLLVQSFSQSVPLGSSSTRQLRNHRSRYREQSEKDAVGARGEGSFTTAMIGNFFLQIGFRTN